MRDAWARRDPNFHASRLHARIAAGAWVPGAGVVLDGPIGLRSVPVGKNPLALATRAEDKEGDADAAIFVS